MVFAVALAWLISSYVTALKKEWNKNPMLHADSTKFYDQPFYMADAQSYLEENPSMAQQRSRMPLYPWLISHFCDPKLDEITQVQRYMRFNAGLSIAALIFIGLICRRFIGGIGALWVVGLTGIHVFVFKAILIQPEILFYLGGFVTFLCMLTFLVEPPSSWIKMLLLGGLAGCCYLLKGTALPMIGLFVGLYLMRFAWDSWRRKRGGEGGGPNWRQASLSLVFLAGFLAVAGTYMVKSYRWYGSFFYDPNSRYYLWAESPEEMFAMQRTGLATGKPHLGAQQIADPDVIPFLKKWVPDDGRRQQFEDLAKKQDVVLEGEWDILPGFKNYAKSHSLGEALKRLGDGYYELWDHNHDHPDGYGPYVIALFLGALVLGFWRGIRAGAAGRKILLARYGWAALLAISSVGISLTLYAWWASVSNRNRFFLTQFLPIIFCTLWIMHRALLSTGWKWKVPGLPFVLQADIFLWLILWIWLYRDDFSFHHPHLVQ